MCFGLEKFHTYIYGRHVTVENDDKLLEMIKQKPIYAAPPQLLCMQKYDYIVQYMPGKDMVQAHCLSHFPSCVKSLPIPMAQAPMSSMCSYQMLNWTSFEAPWNVTQCIVLSITSPSEVGQIKAHCNTRHFWEFWDELVINSGLLLRGTRVCIPPELLDYTLTDMHGTHQGTDRMQAQAREAVYWPGIDANIAHYVYQ